MLYDGPVIDAHHHLWDLALGAHAWLAPEAGERGGLGDLAPLRRQYLPEDYRRDAARQNIVATVHVEAGWSGDPCDETRWLETLSKADGVARVYVAAASLASPEAPAVIEAQASCPRVVGLRDVLSWSVNPARRFAARGDLMRDARWRENLGRLAPLGLVFDLMIFPEQMSEAGALVRDFPNQMFVLNHAGSPIDRDAQGMRRWRAGLAELARAPNVAVKISDLVAYDRDWTLDSLRPIVDHCLACFGPKRAMFASDFPVAGLYASFDEIYQAFHASTGDLTGEEQSDLFFATARRIYRVGD